MRSEATCRIVNDIMRLLSENTGEPLSRNAIRKAVKGNNNQINEMIDWLTTGGLIEETWKGPRGVTSARRYRATRDEPGSSVRPIEGSDG